MADVVLEHRLAEAGLDDVVGVARRAPATGTWAQPMDERAAATLTAAGYDATRHRARTFTPDWFDEQDLILAMDAQQPRRRARPGHRRDEQRAKVRMYR